MSTPLVLANWKMQGSRRFCDTYFADFLPNIEDVVSGVEVGFLPPYVLLESVSRILEQTAYLWGGQTVSVHEPGAHTGEVSADMLVDWGCHFVLVGHSERRMYQSEQDADVAAQFLRCLALDLCPVLCVGEQESARQAGQAAEVVLGQLSAVLDRWGIDSTSDCPPIVIAYEPVWAIGTGMTAQPEDAQYMHRLIRDRIAEYNKVLSQSTRIVYGGSVNPDNAYSLFAQDDVDGGLIGGASLKSQSFIEVIRQCSSCYGFSTS